jgi:DNA repair photolyase
MYTDVYYSRDMAAVIQRSLFEKPDRPMPEFVGTASVRAVETGSLLTPGVGRTADFDYTLNPYRGCTFGCSYCFAASFVPDEEMKANWGKWVEAKIRAVDVLRHRDLRGKKIFMSSATDPYQPLEAKIELTREIVEILAESGARLVVQTRSPLVARDIDLLSRFEYVRVNMSITTDDEEARKKFEPGCASIGRRLEAIARLIDAGIRTNVCVSPMLPMKDPETFGVRLAKMGVAHVYSSWFHMSDKPFASGTRDPAIALLGDTGWRYERFVRARNALKRGFGRHATLSQAFGPI